MAVLEVAKVALEAVSDLFFQIFLKIFLMKRKSMHLMI